MIFEKPDYIPQDEWDAICKKYEGEALPSGPFAVEAPGGPGGHPTRRIDIIKNFDPVHVTEHYALVLAEWAAWHSNRTLKMWEAMQQAAG